MMCGGNVSELYISALKSEKQLIPSRKVSPVA